MSGADDDGNQNPAPAAMRRALARARDGKTLDTSEADVLLRARDDDLDTLLDYAG